jgi:hypothetical protein
VLSVVALGARPARAVAVAAALLVASALVRAQNPFIEAARGNAAASGRAEPIAPTTVARAFVEGCLAGEGASMKAVDWALNQGWEPIDAHVPPGATLLEGRAGTVLAMAASAHPVLLAVDLERRCTVWAERADGPALRTELQRALGEQASRGAARMQPAGERTVERAGAWRQQSQWRWRRAGGSQDFMVGAVTTLAPQPAAQVLNLAPVPSRLEWPATDPTGLPR